MAEEEHTFSRIMREKVERERAFDQQQRELDEAGCTCPRALSPDGPSATIREADLLACPVHRPPILKAGCLCGKTIDVCGDCSGLVANLERMSGIREHYDNTDTSAELEKAVPDPEENTFVRGPEDLTQAELDAMYAAKLAGKLVVTPLPLGVPETGGWCAPSRCAVGVCTTDAEHDESCEGPGWAYARLRIGGDMLMLPEITVRRGGIRYPRFHLHTAIRKTGWRKWVVRTFYHPPTALEIGPFKKREQAEAAEKALLLLNRQVSDLYYDEKDGK